MNFPSFFLLFPMHTAQGLGGRRRHFVKYVVILLTIFGILHLSGDLTTVLPSARRNAPLSPYQPVCRYFTKTRRHFRDLLTDC